MCVCLDENAEQVAALKSDNKAASTNVEMNCKITLNTLESKNMFAISSHIEELPTLLKAPDHAAYSTRKFPLIQA